VINFQEWQYSLSPFAMMYILWRIDIHEAIYTHQDSKMTSYHKGHVSKHVQNGYSKGIFSLGCPLFFMVHLQVKMFHPLGIVLWLHCTIHRRSIALYNLTWLVSQVLPWVLGDRFLQLHSYQEVWAKAIIVIITSYCHW